MRKNTENGKCNMSDKLYLFELESFKTATEEQLKYIYNIYEKCFDFERINNEDIREKLKEYILKETERLSITTMHGYIPLYNQVCDFFNNYIPNIDFKDSSIDKIMTKYKSYLLLQGKSLYHEYNHLLKDEKTVYMPQGYYFLRRFLRFVYKEKIEEDILYTDDFPDMYNNPTNPIKYFNFSKIKQQRVRDEIKEAIVFLTSYNAASTLKSHITSVNKFSQYMSSKYPELTSCADIKKKHISDYILYMKIESGYKAKTYCGMINDVKRLLTEVSMIYGYGKVEAYFDSHEYMKRKTKIERTYTKYEISRFNKALKTINEQLARCMILHQLLGTRISDTLLLETDCIKYNNGNPVIIIRQAKVKRAMEKPIDEDIVKLIKKSIEYTEERYGQTKYIFVNEKNPILPLSYNSLKHSIEKMIKLNDIKDDNGEVLFFSTHVFRRYYGKRLTEMHVDDLTIAKLLGHTDLQTVNRYRRMGDAQIAEETRPFRNYMDLIIEEISVGW